MNGPSDVNGRMTMKQATTMVRPQLLCLVFLLWWAPSVVDAFVPPPRHTSTTVPWRTVPSTNDQQDCAWTTTTMTPRPAPTTNTVRHLQPFPWESSVDNAETEETLLDIKLSIVQGVDSADALKAVQQYTQAFPFSVVLPVQPLQYLPTSDGGVDVLFLRKKTEEKGSVDGGMRFFANLADDDDAVEVVVKRNSDGQTVSKIFSEKLIVQAFYDGIRGKQDDKTGVAPTDKVQVQSVFHRWLL